MLLCRLVKSYLVYHGYSKAADAFAQATGQSIREELDSIKYRQEIRQLIIRGDINAAIKLTYCCYPHIFADNPELLFKLKCREFVIMVVKLAAAMEHNETTKPLKMQTTAAAAAPPPPIACADAGGGGGKAGDFFGGGADLDVEMREAPLASANGHGSSSG